MAHNSQHARDVFTSGLPFHLKPVLALLSLYGDRDGTNIYPSVGRVAYELGISDRQVQRQLTQLVTIGVLVPETARTGGRGQTTHYHLDLDSLPHREPYKPRHGRQGLETVKGDTGVVVYPKRVTSETQNPDMGVAKRVTSETVNPDMGVTRSSSDQGVDQGVDYGASRAAAARAAKYISPSPDPTIHSTEQLADILSRFSRPGETEIEAIQRLGLHVVLTSAAS